MRIITSGRRVTLLSLGIPLFLGVSLDVGAEAASIPHATSMTALAHDKNRIGNGSYNHNAVSIHSPTTNRGPQAISNANAGGRTSSRNAFCKKKRYCKIIQGW
jgi:hypothetical protein